MKIIIPCCGRSSRYSLEKPKYMIVLPNGNLIIQEVINSLCKNTPFDTCDVDIVVKTEDIIKSKINLDKIKFDVKNNVRFVKIDGYTNSPCETIVEYFEDQQISKYNSMIFFKDCDSVLEFEPSLIKLESKDLVSYSDVTDNICDITQKSFIDGSIISEKSKITNIFCNGLYGFNGITIEELKEFSNFSELLTARSNYFIKKSSSYKDYGTIKSFRKEHEKSKVIFCDIDGVLIENESEFFSPLWGESKNFIRENILKINEYYDNGSEIILSSSRKEHVREKTILQLKEAGVKYHRLILNLKTNIPRLLINDCSALNINSAQSITLERDSKNLKNFIL